MSSQYGTCVVLGRGRVGFLTFLIALGVTLALWSSSGAGGRSSLLLTLRQTITFATPTGDVSATGVIQKRVIGRGVGRDAAIHEASYGEAPGVFVPGLGFTFVTFIYPGLEPLGGYRNLVSEACGVPRLGRTGQTVEQWLRDVDRAFVDRCRVPRSIQPILVSFPDPSDPHSAEAYLPDHLPKGISIRSYDVERTTEEVTFGGLSRLGWIKENPVPGVTIQVAGREQYVGISITEDLLAQNTPLGPT
ncbi:hypothetical protein PRN20_04055 [Devosia sp. ZB163]|uniref:hypothetical protein n=1 Tax=Devosia sp. ZB163 TaxID=3025938 RepID=UPI002362E940|nr:hypothetical protein [Devosia sp. ZB163]MDC9822895.1 hypothetical protein [Devosia sp. ZB163]